MAIIYTYPTKSTVETTDLVLITDKSSSSPKDQTKQASISSIKDAINVVDSLNTFTGALTINSGAGISVSNADPNITITNTGVLSVTATSPVATSGATGAITLSLDTVPVSKGGTNLTSYTQGDLLYAPSGAALQGLGIGTPGQVLKVNSGGNSPEWSSDTDTTYTAGDGLDLTGTVFSTDLKANGGLVIESTELALDLGATAITGNLKQSNGGTGLSSTATLLNSNVNYSSDGSGTLAVANGGTGLSTVGLGYIPRGNVGSALITDAYIMYEGTSKSLKLRGTGNTQPTLSCTLGIDDAQGPSTKIACIGLTPTGAQGARGIHIDLGAYNEAMQINRNNGLANVALRFYQTVSGSTDIGSITMTNSATAYNTSSDYRLKENIVDMTGAVDRVKQLSPKRFNFTSEPDKVVDGFLAHEAQSVVPEAVTGVKDGMKTEEDEDGNSIQVPEYQGIDQAKLVPILVGAIKELTARIEALEA